MVVMLIKTPLLLLINENYKRRITEVKTTNRDICRSYSHRGEPILLTEFGGISYQMNEDKGWGYTAVGDAEHLLSEYKRIILAIKESTALVGYCYTQLTDVEQETNGLLTYDRKPKLPVEKVKEVNDLIQKYK